PSTIVTAEETNRIRGYFSTSKYASFRRCSSRISLSVLIEAASTLTSKLSAATFCGSNRIVPCNPLKDPSLLMPKFLILKLIVDPSLTGRKECPGDWAYEDIIASCVRTNPMTYRIALLIFRIQFLQFFDIHKADLLPVIRQDAFTLQLVDQR